MKKRIIAVALALVMLLSFAACSGKKDDEKKDDSSSKTTTTEALKKGDELFYGSWNASLKMKDVIKESVDEEETEDFIEYFDDIDMNLTFTFNKDNTFSMEWKDEDIEDAVVKIKEAMTKALCAMLKEKEASLKSKSDAEIIKYYEKMTGESLDKTLEDQFGKDAMKKSFADDIAQEGKYKVVDNTLYMYDGEEFKEDKADSFEFDAKSNDEVKITDVRIVESKEAENIFDNDLVLVRVK